MLWSIFDKHINCEKRKGCWRLELALLVMPSILYVITAYSRDTAPGHRDHRLVISAGPLNSSHDNLTPSGSATAQVVDSALAVFHILLRNSRQKVEMNERDVLTK